jgi:pyruvate/2-oxoglutarate dehydrogenase complex dihydrolipoamide dehydrogenase (E3) component
MYHYDVIVIGGGQRGLLARRRRAIHAAPEAGAEGRPTWRGQDGQA